MTVAFDWQVFHAESFRRLQQYLQIDTANPPGNVRLAVDFLQGVLKQEGIAFKTYEADAAGGKINLVARLSASSPREKPVLLLNHSDVVPVERERWTVDPFGGMVKSVPLHGRPGPVDHIFARGALDMKGMAMLELNALILLKRLQIPLTRDVMILFAADEEVGSMMGAEWMVAHHFSDLDPGVVINEGGEGSLDVLTKDGRPIYAVQVGEKQVLWMKWIVEGTSGHASIPLAGNASERLSAALQAGLGWVRKRAPESDPVIDLLRGRLGAIHDTPFTAAIQHDTVSLTSLRSGVGDPPKINVIPGRAEATVDGRLLPATDRQAFLVGLRGAVEPYGVRIELQQESPPAPASPLDHPAWRAIEEGIHAVAPGVPVVPIISSGATDSRFFRAKGVPCYGFMPMVLPEEIMATMHSHDERIPVDEFHRGTEIMFEMVKRLTTFL